MQECGPWLWIILVLTIGGHAYLSPCSDSLGLDVVIFKNPIS